jgi:hypothetical protein
MRVPSFPNHLIVAEWSLSVFRRADTMAIDLNAAAKEIAEKVAANAGVAPELCFAPILFGLQDLFAEHAQENTP